MKRKLPLAVAFAPFFLRKLPCAIAVFTALCLFNLPSSFAQQWTILGNETQVSSVAATYTSIAVLDEIPYVVYKEGSAGAKVKKRNSTTGAWEQVGDNIGTNVSYSRIYVDKVDNIYVSYVDVANGNRLAVKKYNTGTNTWDPLGNNSTNLYVSSGTVNGMNNITQYSSTPRSSMAFNSDNNPYIAFSEGTGMTPYVMMFNGITWVPVGTGAVNATAIGVSVSLVVDEADVPWVTYVSLAGNTSTTGSMALYRISNGIWTAATATPIGGIRHNSMALNSAGNLAIAYFNAGNSNRATVIVYNKTAATWGTATSLSFRDAPSLTLIRDVSGNLYCSFIDFINNPATAPVRSVARVFKQNASATTWTEIKDPAVVTGIDEPVGHLTIAAGTEVPFIVYTKTNSSAVNTPVVRKYSPPPPPAVLTSNEPSNIAFTTAVAGGNITSDGGSGITQRGVVYSTSPNPTTANTKVVAPAAGTGSFNVTLTGLTPSAYYYVRAYAINGAGTTYGNTVNLYSPAPPDAVVTTPKQMEFLTRGVVAVRKTTSQVFISWRMLGTDPSTIAFNIYRDGIKLNAAPITTSTNYLDNTSANGTYTVKPIINGTEGAASAPVSVWANNQLSVPLQIPPGGTTPDGKAYTYTANDASVGDMDGDGNYEIVLRWAPTVENHNSGGYSGNQIFDCYKLDGTRLWRIDLGINMNAGPHYNQFMVYDFDGDGKAEIILKTADGTKDGLGNIIGNATVDYRNSAGWVQQGPEYLTVFNGLTGAAMATTAYEPARGNVADWGDNYGNRQDRFVNAVAYLDGARPSLIVGRGYYEKLARAAYNWRDGQLTLLWKFDSEDPTTPGNIAFSSMGNHQMTIGDVDGDGKDEVINGSSAINDNGKGLWTTGKGHGDALHMTDMDPDRPGQEIWINLESPGQYTPLGLRQYDAKTGATNWGVATTGDVGRSLAADVDPSHKGYEMWGSSGNLYDARGNQISTSKPTGGSQAVNSGIWWDGDLGRELLDGTIMDKWNPMTNSLNRLFTIYNAAPVSSSNDTKKNPALQADILGDWREEIILRRTDNTALIIFTTNIPTENRIYTLMHDPQYRTAIAWQNSAYNQPPYPSFYVGYDMPAPPTPNIVVKYLLAPEVSNITKSTGPATCDTTVDYAAEATGYPVPTYTYAFTGATTATGTGTGTGSLFKKGITVVNVTATNGFDTVKYSFNVTVIDTIKPVIIVSDTTLVTNDGCTATGVVLSKTVSDNCSDTAHLTVTNDAPSSFPVGTTTVTWTVTDEAGNAQTATQTVVVRDTITPAITAPDSVNVAADNGSCAATNVDLGTPVTADNCGVGTVTNDAPSAYPVGVTTVTWTVTDVHGNASTATQTVTVIDNQAPTVSAPVNVTADADNGSCSASGVALGTPVTSDNCGVASVTNDAPLTFPVGTTTVTWTVADVHGNSSTATQTVTVKDNQSPIVSAPPAFFFCYNNSNSYTVPSLSASDNCGVAAITYNISGATVRSGSGVNASGTFNVGVSTINWKVSDIHNNQTTVSSTVTVNPSLTAGIADVYAVNQALDNRNTLYIGYGPSALTITATPAGGTAPYTYHWNSGQSTASVSVSSAGTYTVTVTDAKGCTTTASITISVLDVTCGNNKDKVMICHNGNTICVASGAVQTHLDHGDNIGACTSSTVKTSGASLESLEPTVSVSPAAVLVYPNPSAGRFTVQLDNFTVAKATVMVLNLNGQVVAQKVVAIKGARQSVAFNLSNPAQSVYLLKVISEDGVTTQKILIGK